MEKLLTRGQSNNSTLHFEDGIEVWPCHCGEVNAGITDWLHHNCDHEKLIGMYYGEREGTILASCVQCDKDFWVDLTTLEA